MSCIVLLFPGLFPVSSQTNPSSPFPIFTIHSVSLHSQVVQGVSKKHTHNKQHFWGPFWRDHAPTHSSVGSPVADTTCSCSPNLQSEKHTTVQGGYRKEKPVFLFQIKMHCSKRPCFSFQAPLLSPVVSKLRKLFKHTTTTTVLNTWKSHLHRSSSVQAQIPQHRCIQSLPPHSCKFHFHTGFQQHIHQYLQAVKARIHS